MSRQWEAELTLEPNEVLVLIQNQFPELKAEKIRLLGAGWDNTAFIINEELIFRFPRREISLGLLEAEWALLPKIASLLPVSIPIPRWRGSPSDCFPWPFIGYRMLSGFTACYANLSENQRESLAVPIAQFLSALHKIPPHKTKDFMFYGDNFSRVEGSSLTQKIHLNLQEMELLGLLQEKDKLYSLIERLQSYRAPIMDTFVHGDFYVRHLLLNEKHDLVGVIDWGDMHIGDRAIDLAIAHSFLPISSHALFQKTYGPISKETWNLSKLRALFSSSMLALFGHHSKDPSLLREGLRSLTIMANSKIE